MGYFSFERFVWHVGAKSDEIGMDFDSYTLICSIVSADAGYNPEDFRNAMMCVETTRQWIHVIDSRRRLQVPCAIERGFCQTPQCLN